MAKNVSRETFLAISESLNVSRETFLGVLMGGNAEIWHKVFHVKHFMPDFEGVCRKIMFHKLVKHYFATHHSISYRSFII